MRIAITGTPGVGKTTAVDHLTTDLDVIHLNEIINGEGFTIGLDPDRSTALIDLDTVAAWLDGRDDVLFESHVAHRFPADRIIVLRCEPTVLRRRLLDRGESVAKATENADSEALDVILVETIDRFDESKIYEIDTTEHTPSETARTIKAVIDGDREPSVGTVSYIEFLEP